MNSIIKWISTLSLLIMIFVFFSCDFSSGPETYLIDFEDGTFGNLQHNSGWVITTLNDGNKVAEPDGNQFAVGLNYPILLGTDFTNTIRFNIKTLTHSEVPNLSFSTIDGDVINLLVSNNIVYLHTGNEPNNYSEGKEEALTLDLNTWYKLEVNVSNGSVFTVKIDNNPVINYTFSNKLNFNEVSYSAYPDIAEIYLDDIEVIIE